MTPRVVVVGDLIHDVLAEVDGPLAPDTDTFAPVHAHPGGSGANTAAWLALLGVESHLVARVGDDPLGELLEAELREAGVKPCLARDAKLFTGKVVVLVSGTGERTMITARGAGENLRPEDLPQTLFHPQTHLHLSGYLFSNDSRKETALEALHLARKTGMTVSIDPSSTTLLRDVGPPLFLEWTSDADLLFPNREEGALLAGTQDPDAILDALIHAYRGVALKLGASGAAYADAAGRRAHAPAIAARAMDTTGAGDALCAGFLAAWLTGGDPKSALHKGAELAARAVARVGGRSNA